jgi:hypothetical protein
MPILVVAPSEVNAGKRQPAESRKPRKSLQARRPNSPSESIVEARSSKVGALLRMLVWRNGRSIVIVSDKSDAQE